MSTTECKRCGGGGHIAKYTHVEGGRCFGCGKLFGARVRLTNRELSIRELHAYISACRSRPVTPDGRGECRAEWLAAVCTPDAREGLPAMLPALLAGAPADVRARAVAALAKLLPAGALAAHGVAA